MRLRRGVSIADIATRRYLGIVLISPLVLQVPFAQLSAKRVVVLSENENRIE